MNILIYTLGLPPYRRGGLTRYSIDLARELAKKDQVTVLFPGKMSINKNSKKVSFKTVKTKEKFKLVEMVNPLPVSLNFGVEDDTLFWGKREEKNIIKFVNEVKPDVIHLHTIMGLPFELIDYAKKRKIKIILTTHDFYGFCPKILENKEKAKQLLKYDTCTYDCFLCKQGLSWKKIYIMQSHIYKFLKKHNFLNWIRRYQKKYVVKKKDKPIVFSDKKILDKLELRTKYLSVLKKIDFFHFNSEVSRVYIKKFLPNASGRVLMLSHADIKDNRQKKNFLKNKKINFAYIGPYDKKKGFYLLKKVFSELSHEFDNFTLQLYGDNLKDIFFEDYFVYNHGVVSYNSLKNEYSKIDVLIVPSLWHETFGFTVLEALSNGVPVICSNMVGAKELISDDELIFNDKDELIDILKRILKDPEIIGKYKKNVMGYNLPLDFSEHTKEVFDLIYS